MASQNDIGFKSFPVSAAISAFLVVDLNYDGTLTPAANGFKGIGVLQEDAALLQNIATAQAANSIANTALVKLFSAPGTIMAQITGGITITPGFLYSVVTGGFVGNTNGTTNPAFLKAMTTAAGASGGAIVEFGYGLV